MGKWDKLDKSGMVSPQPWFRASFHNNKITCILCSTLEKPSVFFFSTHFLIFRTVTCVFWVLDQTLWPKKVLWKEFLRSRRYLLNRGSSRLAVQSHRHFDLTCQQESDCFISGFSLFIRPFWKKLTYYGMTLSVRPSVNNSCTLHNSVTVQDIFMQIYRNMY